MVDWEGIDLVDGETKYRLLAHGSRGTYELSWGRDVPKCSECGTSLPQLDPQAGDFPCPECGVMCTNFAPTERFARLYPEVEQILLAEKTATQDSGQKHPDPLPGERPSSLDHRCPSCGGDLELTVETQRIHTCKYCSSDLFIPDELWTKLHPVVRVRPWFVDSVTVAAPSANHADESAWGSRGFSAMPSVGEEWGEQERDPSNKWILLIIAAIGAIVVIGAVMVGLASC